MFKKIWRNRGKALYEKHFPKDNLTDEEKVWKRLSQTIPEIHYIDLGSMSSLDAMCVIEYMKSAIK